MIEAGLLRGRVTRVVAGEGVWVVVPSLGGMEVGPLEQMGGPYSAGDRVVVGELDEAGSGLVVLGRVQLQPTSPEPSEPAGATVAIGDYLTGVGVIDSGSLPLTAGNVLFYPVDVTQEATFSHVGYRISTNAVGGTPALSFAVYPDDGNNRPDTTHRLATTATDNLTSGTNKELAFTTPLTLAPGRYWVASLYTIGTAPTTAPQVNVVSRAASGWSDSAIFWFYGGLPALSLKLTGRTTLPTTPTAPTSARDNPVFFGLKRSA